MTSGSQIPIMQKIQHKPMQQHKLFEPQQQIGSGLWIAEPTCTPLHL
jgi:hypothetical protein